MRSRRGLLDQSSAVLSEAAEGLGDYPVSMDCFAARTEVEGLLVSVFFATY